MSYPTTEDVDNAVPVLGVPTRAGVNAVLKSLIESRGDTDGVCELVGGKVPLDRLHSSSNEYKGVWNAASNSPALTNAQAGASAGWYYYVSTAGTHTFGAIEYSFDVGDVVMYNGSAWERIRTSAVSSVNGKKGEVSLTSSDISYEASNVKAILDSLTGLFAGGTGPATTSISNTAKVSLGTLDFFIMKNATNSNLEYGVRNRGTSTIYGEYWRSYYGNATPVSNSGVYSFSVTANGTYEVQSVTVGDTHQNRAEVFYRISGACYKVDYVFHSTPETGSHIIYAHRIA